VQSKVRRFYIEARHGAYQVVEQVGEKYNVLESKLTLNQANKLYNQINKA